MDDAQNRRVVGGNMSAVAKTIAKRSLHSALPRTVDLWYDDEKFSHSDGRLLRVRRDKPEGSDVIGSCGVKKQ